MLLLNVAELLLNQIKNEIYFNHKLPQVFGVLLGGDIASQVFQSFRDVLAQHGLQIYSREYLPDRGQARVSLVTTWGFPFVWTAIEQNREANRHFAFLFLKFVPKVTESTKPAA